MGSDKLVLGTIGGVIGAIIGAAAWIVVAFVSARYFGFPSIFVGIITGLGVRVFGRGEEYIFGLIAALLTLVGSLVGSFGSAFMISPSDDFNVGLILGIWKDNVGLIDLGALALALWIAYAFAFDGE